MSRTTVLQIIAAVITIAVLAVLHQGLDWFLSRLNKDFLSGLFFGSFGVTIIFMILIWADHRRLAARNGRTREQQGPRDFIDL